MTQSILRRLDGLFNRCHGIFAFCEDPDCLIRLRHTRTTRRIELGRCYVSTGEPVLMIHLWNEHIPPLPPSGPTLAWGLRAQRMFVRSLHIVARHLRDKPQLTGIRAIGGATMLFSPVTRYGGTDLMRRLGFTVTTYRSPWGRFGDLWENIYSWFLLRAYSPRSLRGKNLRTILLRRRAEIWMPIEEFMRRYCREEAEGRNRR